MEVRPGYKQTEVGVIPEEWEVENLQNVCREPITYGIVQCGPHVRDGVPYVRVSDMDSQELSVDGMLRTSKVIAAKFGRSTVAAGDLVYALRGKVGEVREVTTEIAGANLTQGTARLSPGEKVASKYLLWAMRHPGTVQQASLDAKGTTFREITLADLRNLKILVPPPPEQRAIAETLSDVDGLLAALDRLIAKKRDLKQAAMQQLLTGQTRLPGFHGDWEVKRVADFGAIVTGGTPRTDVKEYWGEGYPWVTPTDITTQRDMYTSARTLTENGLNLIRMLPANTVLVTCIASIGKNAILRSKGGCNQQINAVIPNNENVAEFLYYLFEASKHYLLSSAGTTATSIVSKANFGEMTFTVPPLLEQTAIAEVLSDMDTELAALEQRRDKTRLLKQAMMQELLTGRTRLVPPGGRE